MAHNVFYDSKAWRKKREYIKRRDGQLCRRCLESGKVVAANTVHHIKPLNEFPALGLADGNLMSLCRECHEAVHDYRQGARQSERRMVQVPQGVRVIRMK